MVDCLNHGLNGLRRFHGLNDVFDGRDLEKISIALTNHSLDGRDSEIAPTNAGVRCRSTYGCWIWQSSRSSIGGWRRGGMEKSRGFLSRSLSSRLMVSGEETKIGRRESGRTSEREGREIV